MNGIVNTCRPGVHCQDEVSRRGITSHAHAHVHQTTILKSGHSPIQRTISYSERRVSSSDGRTKDEGFTRDGMLAEIRRIYTP